MAQPTLVYSQIQDHIINQKKEVKLMLIIVVLEVMEENII